MPNVQLNSQQYIQRPAGYSQLAVYLAVYSITSRVQMYSWQYNSILNYQSLPNVQLVIQQYIELPAGYSQLAAGLEKSTRPLVFTSSSGCRASEILDDSQCKLIFYPYMSIIFVMQGKCLFWDISRPGQYIQLYIQLPARFECTAGYSTV